MNPLDPDRLKMLAHSDPEHWAPWLYASEGKRMAQEILALRGMVGSAGVSVEAIDASTDEPPTVIPCKG